MKLLLVFVLVISALVTTACGVFDRAEAGLTGFSRVCVDGVEYLQFTSGATVAYTPEGFIKRCR